MRYWYLYMLFDYKIKKITASVVNESILDE